MKQNSQPLRSQAAWLSDVVTVGEDALDLTEALTIIANERLHQNRPYSSIASALHPAIASIKSRSKQSNTVDEKISLLNREVLPAIQRAVHGELRWLHEAFGNSAGDCLIKTLLYIIAAEHLSLQLSAVQVPKHTFAAYVHGDFRRNIETTKEGQHFDAEYYRRLCSTDPEDLETLPNDADSLYLYLQPITKRQLIGILLCQGGASFESRPEDYQLAARVSPSFYYPWKHLMGYYGTHQDWSESEALASKAIEQASYVPSLYAARCVSRIMQKKCDVAIQDINAALKLAPNHAIYHYWRSSALYLSEQFDLALAAGMRAVELAPTVSDFWKLRASCYEKLKRFENSASDYSRAIDLSPRDPELYKKRARVWAMMGDEGRWDNDLKKAKELDQGR